MSPGFGREIVLFMSEQVTSESRGGSVTETVVQLDPEQLAEGSVPPSLKRYALFMVVAAAYILPFMRVLMVGTDEGTLDYGALRVLRGQVFARDFFEVIGPGTFYWLAAFFKMFGVSFLTTRICLFVTSFGTACAMFFLSRRICGRYQSFPCILLAATSFGGLWPAISHHDDSNFFALMGVACISLWQERYSRSLLVTGGALAGLTTAFLQPKGILLMAAFVVFVVIQRRSYPNLISSLQSILSGYVGVVGTIILYFWSKSSLHDLIYTTVTWPSKHYGAVNAVPYAHGILINYWDHWVSARSVFPGILAIAAVMMIPIFYVAILPALLPLLGLKCRFDLQHPQVQLLWLAGIALWVSELHRTDMSHLVFGSPLLIILSIHYLTTDTGRVATAALQILRISSVCLACFNLFILAAANTVQTRMGSVRMFTDWKAHVFVEENIPAGAEIFAYPYCPSYYFVHDLLNPTRFSIMTYNYNTKDQFEEVVRTLDRRRVKYVVWDVRFQEAENSVFLSGLPPMDQQIIEPYLQSHYDVMSVIDGKRIMRRKVVIDEHN